MPNDDAEAKLTIEEQRALLAVARRSLVSAVTDQKLPALDFSYAVLQERRGAFVTLHRRGQLRGCIGYVLPLYPLRETVEQAARAAAVRDPRFPPVSPDELPEIDIEISVLSPMRRVQDVRQIEVGVHGLMIKKGAHTGLLLPQVAPQYAWDREHFLRQTCIKAGLPPDAWQEGDADILMYSAQVFGEQDV